MLAHRLKAEELVEAGALREAITQLRYALRFEKDAYERARLYLALARIYRLCVRMKNAHLELQRAFVELGLAWPGNSIKAFLCSALTSSHWPRLHPDVERHPRETKAALLAELFEEVGLSAYYLRQTWTLLQVTLRGRKPCHDIGDSPALLNWYGGTACILAIVDLTLHGFINFFFYVSPKTYAQRMGIFTRSSHACLQKCHEVAERLGGSTHRGKAMIWEALLAEYQGEPLLSAKLFERCLLEYGRVLDPCDIRMAAVTLSINCLFRGHFQESLDALQKQVECNPVLREFYDDTSLQNVPWYTIGPRAMLGQIKDMDRMIRICSSILSVDKDEKWLLAQYVGELLIAGRKAGLSISQAEDLISRFEVLGMSPRGTHSETGFYWVAEAYTRFSMAAQDRSFIYKFKRSVRRLSHTLPQPTTHSHLAVLRAGLAWLENRQTTYHQWCQRAIAEARAIDNQWALQELDEIRQLAARQWGAGGHFEIKH